MTEETIHMRCELENLEKRDSATYDFSWVI
jgi:hypothetical protein